jgi:hypothetical protein
MLAQLPIGDDIGRYLAVTLEAFLCEPGGNEKETHTKSDQYSPQHMAPLLTGSFLRESGLFTFPLEP